MAINNAEKRKAASGIQVTLIVGVTNNASKDEQWRRQAGWGYSVILKVIGLIHSFIMPSRTRAFTMSDKTNTFTTVSKTRIFKLD